MLRLVLGPAGSGKTHWARQDLLKRAEAGQTGLFLLVPEQFSFETERGMLRLLGPKNAPLVEVESFTRLAQRIFSQTGGRAGRVIDDAGRAVLMGLALEQVSHELELYGRHADKPEFANQMLTVVRECKQAGACGEDLERLARALPDGVLRQKTTEIGRIMAVYEALVGRDYIDSDDDLTVLARKLMDFQYLAGKTVVLDSFKGFTHQQMLVLEQMLVQADSVTVTLCCDGLNGEPFDRFASVRRTARQLLELAKKTGVSVEPPLYLTEQKRFAVPSLCHLERNLFVSDAQAYTQPAKEVCVSRFANLYEEADGVAREIHRLAREEGLRYREIAVIARNIEDYNGILDAALERYEIPYFMDCRRPAASLPLFRLVMAAFDIVENGYDKQNIFVLLKTGLCGLSTLEISQLENYALLWNISGRRWEQEWTANPAGFAEEFSPAQKAELEKLNLLRQKAVAPVAAFRFALKRGKTGADLGGAVFQLLLDYEADKALAALCETLEKAGEAQAGQDQRQSWGLLMETLDQTVLALEGLPVRGKQYAGLWRLCVSFQDMGRLPQGLDQVTVGNAERMRPNSPAAVFVVGVNDGVFPRLLSGSGLLTPAERDKLITLGLEISDHGQEQASEERFLLYSSLCAASRRVYMSYLAKDGSGKPMAPSELIQRVEEILPDCGRPADAGNPMSLVEAVRPSMALAARLFRSGTPFAASLFSYLSGLPALSGQMNAIRRAANKREFHLSGEIAEKLFGKNMRLTASKIDVFHRCRFSYFCQYGVKAKPFRTAEMDVLERGTLIHKVLEQAVNQFGGKELAEVPEKELRSFVDQRLDEYVNQVMGGWQDKAPSMKYIIGRIARLLCLLLRHIGEGLHSSEFVPEKTELTFGGSDGVPPVALPLPDGGSVSLGGVIDRVDVYRKNGKAYVRVVDYKTGRREFNLSDVVYGQNLQMLTYLFALKKSGDAVMGEPVLPGGVLYLPARPPSVDLPRYAPREQVEKELKKQLKMNGLLLNDPDVLNAMEKGGEGVYTPYRLTKTGAPDGRYSSVADAAALGVIERHIDRLLTEMGAALHAGDISVNPRDGTDVTACQYCEYAAVCERDAWEENSQTPKWKASDALKLMEGEEKDGLSGNAGAEERH